MKSRAVRKKPKGSPADETSAALGLRAHSGWAALVVVAGSGRSPRVIDRRIIKLADPLIPGSKQPYHTAAGWPLSKAEEFIGRCTSATMRMAQDAVEVVVRELGRKGSRLVGCGVLAASGRRLPPLAQTLASHALIHTAEGELFRNALVEAAESCRLPVARVPERELFPRAVRDLRLPLPKLQIQVSDMGRPLGPPWTQDQKLAALLAWMLLATGTSRLRGPSSHKKQ